MQWSAIFPTEQVTQQQSALFVKKLLAVAVRMMRGCCICIAILMNSNSRDGSIITHTCICISHNIIHNVISA